jgi:hypothetical protein
MTVIENQTFESETIVMDGKFFKNCTISGCTLFFCGGDFGWVDCRLGEPMPCILKFEGAASRTIAYLKAFGKLARDFGTEAGAKLS